MCSLVGAAPVVPQYSVDAVWGKKSGSYCRVISEFNADISCKDLFGFFGIVKISDYNLQVAKLRKILENSSIEENSQQLNINFHEKCEWNACFMTKTFFVAKENL